MIKFTCLLILLFFILSMPSYASWCNNYYITAQGIWKTDPVNKIPFLFIYLGMSEKDIKSAMGRDPNRETNIPSGKNVLTYNDSLKEPSGITFYVNNDRLVAISVFINKIPAEGGIFIGSDKMDVTALYGKNYRQETISGHGAGISYDTTRGTIFFSLNSFNKVQEIIIYFKGEW